MESIMKIAYAVLFVWALMTFWPLVLLLLAALALFLFYTSWKTKKLLKESEQDTSAAFVTDSKKSTVIIDAEYTEKEIEHDKA